MGFYVNPTNGDSKRKFLLENGEQISLAEIQEYKFGSGNPLAPVVLMDNGAFTAAGVAYSSGELKEFTRPEDNRPKTYFLVKKDALYAFGGTNMSKEQIMDI